MIELHKVKLGSLFAAGLAVCAASVSHGSILTFDDLPTSTGGTMMPEMHGGLRWGSGFGTSWHYMSLLSNPSNNFLALSGTSTYFGSPLGGNDFYFEGADFWSRRGADANGDFYFVLYHDGVTVYNGLTADGGRQRFNGGSQFFTPGYAGLVDGVAIAFDNDDWDHLAMDNVRVTFVPAPGTALFAAGAGVLAVRRRRVSARA